MGEPLAEDPGCQTGCVRWVVVRQDVHGNRVDVTDFATESEAVALVETFESGYPHHQGYFVERRDVPARDNEH